MDIEVLRKTESPDELFCQAARGDYYEGFVGDTDLREVMSGVKWEDYHLEGLTDILHKEGSGAHHYVNGTVEGYLDGENALDESIMFEAKKRAFIEKQLSRGHYGPAEHPQITFAIKGVSRALMAQITRHRFLTFDVQSQRYADFSDKSIIVPPTLLSNEQRHERYPHIYDENGEHFNRDEGHFDMDEENRRHWRNAFIYQQEEQFSFYEDMVNAGIPKEDARFALPIGTPVNMTVSGNARTFLHLFNLRQKPDSQWEIRELAWRMGNHLMDWSPYTYNWYDKSRPHKLSP
jgi:thymidylate synthase (FAD)